ncbi:MAG: MFS transporter [Thermomicrobiales bacterium]
MASILEHGLTGPTTSSILDDEIRLEALRPVQRRTLVALAATQVLGLAGLAAGGTVGGLIGRDLLGGTTWAGLPQASLVVGTAATAVPLSRYMARAGRRPGLRLGWLLGAAGASLVVAAVIWRSPALLLAGMILVGCASAAGDAAKYAAADLARPAARGAAIGAVVAASTVSAVVGPNLTGPTAGLAQILGMPDLAGPFVLAIVAFGLAALVLTLFLRPDPLLVAGRLAHPAAHTHAPGATPRTPLSALLRRPGVSLGLGAMSVANFVMILVMTMAPIHIAAHDDSLNVIGLAVSAHIAGMFALSPLTGRLCDQLGRAPVIGLGGCWLVAAGALAATAAPHDTVVLILSLVLLGVGWNFGLIGGSTLLTDAVPEIDRPRIQGIADASAGIAGMVGSVASGLLLAAAGFAALGLVAVVVAAGLAGVSLRWVTKPSPMRAPGDLG